MSEDYPDAPIFNSVASDVAPDPSASSATRMPKAAQKLGGMFGDNKQRGGPRALVKGDIDKLAGMYALMGMAVAPVKPQIGLAFTEQADACATAWFDVARENDAVRRAILWIVEGGAWGALFLAHIPIIITAIPPDALPDTVRTMLSGYGEETPEENAA